MINLEPEDYVKVLKTENPKMETGKPARVVCINTDKTILVEDEEGNHDTLELGEWEKI